MTLAVAWKLLAIFATVSLGWVAARAGWVGGRPGAGAGLPAATRTLSDVAFHLFVPALLFRTMARQSSGGTTPTSSIAGRSAVWWSRSSPVSRLSKSK